jgi:hypothetical protein
MEGQDAPNAKVRSSDRGPPKDKPNARKSSLIGRTMRRAKWLAGGPADWFGRKSVMSGAGLISGLWRQSRRPVQRDSRFKVDDDGSFDLAATAFSYGISVEALEQRLEQRRRMTFMISYGASLVAILSVIFWIHSAINEPYTPARIMMAFEFLPFLSLFCLVAFYNALLNFQIRMRRTANWREFLSTEAGFFPR